MGSISFILPAYKRRFLRESISSILAQTYSDFSLVVVDDCSPEDLKTIVDKFDDARISYFRNTSNVGKGNLVSAWNNAMKYATSEWCILASDDDIYEPTFLETLITLHNKYPQCNLLHGRATIIDEAGVITHTAEPRPEYESQAQFIYNRAAKRIVQCAPDFMFKTAELRTIGGFVDFPLAWYSDDATWFKLAKNGVACSQEPLFNFRNSGSNISSSFNLVTTKIKASKLFLEWLGKFAKEITVSSAVDQELLQMLIPETRRGVLRDTCYDLGHTTPWNCIRTVLTLDSPIIDKFRMLRMALPYFILNRNNK